MVAPRYWTRGLRRDIDVNVFCAFCGEHRKIPISYMPCPYEELVKPLGDWPTVEEEDDNERLISMLGFAREHRDCIIIKHGTSPLAALWRRTLKVTWAAKFKPLELLFAVLLVIFSVAIRTPRRIIDAYADWRVRAYYRREAKRQERRQRRPPH